ncbi:MULTISPECIES: HAD family phosphatase [unclassified Rhizobacter]|uniref:HAD family hydrolase n=1 Tax=unclassified Rhizobacter TaxID=2640088 RepID=UPI0006F84420|nr:MULTISPECIES: HAD family phosphatase [unclassified Rhizobacter]KQU77173.1 hydrolase [Rhizobacter sp. Root29]KQW12753.1 hydrolase [Rhizobacter sp. Root1238]KRB22341.1 hydrolase [Rhizobacter sp. Root16D2]
MKLALFDLDHTLIPFDSGMAWTRFLAQRGVLPPEAPAAYLACCQQYVAGTLDIRAMHRATVAPLSAFARAQIDAWSGEFELAMAPQIPRDMQALVARHREAGDRCAVVTATTRFIAEPFARLFGIPQVLATEGEWRDGVLTGEIDGEPCHREHKLSRVLAWLPRPGGLGAFEQSWFYSDAASDLPLLQAVSHPVAVRPEPVLRAHALRAGWPVLDQGP